jgi:hypothetical protein
LDSTRTSKDQLERIKELARELRQSAVIPRTARAADTTIEELESKLSASLEATAPPPVSPRAKTTPPQAATPTTPDTGNHGVARSSREEPKRADLPATADRHRLHSQEQETSGHAAGVWAYGKHPPEWVGAGLALLVQAIWPYIEERYQRACGHEWLETALQRSGSRRKPRMPSVDPYFVLSTLLDREVFDADDFPRTLVHVARGLRNDGAHGRVETVDDAYRAIDTFELLIKRIGLTIPEDLTELRDGVKHELCAGPSGRPIS